MNSSRTRKSATVRGTILLLAFLVASLSSGFDFLADHTSTQTRVANTHEEGGSSQRHLIRSEGVKTAPECTACYFYKLLSQSVVPGRSLVSKTHTSARYSDFGFLNLSLLSLERKDNRGPPDSL